MYLKLTYIQLSLDIYQHISYHVQNQEKEENISSMKTHRMPNKWQYLTCIKVQNDLVTPRL